MLEVDRLCVEINGALLLEDVSFQLARSEMLCVVGESGAGKSTLMKALQGLVPARCQRFHFEPANIDASEAMPQMIGLPETRWVMQDPLAALNPRLSLGRSIAESLHGRGYTKAKLRKAVEKALEEVELDPAFYDRLPGQVSLGQAQRACLARALVAQPQLIIFDEPLSALDAIVQKKVAQRMDALRRETQTAYLVVTHDMGFAAVYADQVLVLQKGRVADYQPRTTFFDSPASPYSASLIEAARSLGALEGTL
ncbi:ABC transporter ATP-binding protein [Parasulfitobacter algicola]|uniref:ABC transporter ATP-binding protein n=1 Tax=Parasulfitobacter algicola TaxID=2614809 RepID=A0ABX2IV74_9RHOB|nr:dipeptide/oligopeptide/nickel ABC transporter ATP-binding protein [Sulfitobacter algicola]NSX56817.1 ABC transporter ATP-binding protein [Sulfitobacter algicola]